MNPSFETLQIVAKIYGISVDDLKGGKQRKDIIEAQQLAAYLLTELNYFYYPDIEQILGEDRINIINSYNKILRDMKINPGFKTFVEYIIDYLQKICAPPKYEFRTSKYILKTNRGIEITKREADILSEYRKGATFKKIASTIKVTPVRIRQILMRTFIKELDQKAISGFRIDAQEYINYQIDLHNKLRRLLGDQQIKRSLKKPYRLVNSMKKTLLTLVEDVRTYFINAGEGFILDLPAINHCI